MLLPFLSVEGALLSVDWVRALACFFLASTGSDVNRRISTGSASDVTADVNPLFSIAWQRQQQQQQQQQQQGELSSLRQLHF